MDYTLSNHSVQKSRNHPWFSVFSSLHIHSISISWLLFLEIIYNIQKFLVSIIIPFLGYYSIFLTVFLLLLLILLPLNHMTCEVIFKNIIKANNPHLLLFYSSLIFFFSKHTEVLSVRHTKLVPVFRNLYSLCVQTLSRHLCGSLSPFFQVSTQMISLPGIFLDH